VTIRKQLIECACPACNAGYGFLPEKAESEATCDHCNTTFTIPVGLPTKMVEVSSDRGRPLTPEETMAFYNSPAGRAYLASQAPSGSTLARRAAPAGMVPPDHYMPTTVSPQMVQQTTGNTIKIWFLKLFGFETVVDQKTSNAMATTALGGVLVALGAVVMARMGMKPKA
jgi:hypothetical protein